MKGFPNQVSDFGTLAAALRVLVELLQSGEDARDDGVYGEALIRRQVLRTGHKPVPVEEYLNAQKAKPRASDRSYRTCARGLRELFRIMDLVDDSTGELEVTPEGRRIAELPQDGQRSEALKLWRPVVLQMVHQGRDAEASHPYQVLLRLVARRPGITRGKCALALEAKDDSEGELDRIVQLAGLDEDQIRVRVGVTKSNWSNAKKILPRFAEQLGDVHKVGQRFYLSDVPGGPRQSDRGVERGAVASGARAPRKATQVTAASIAKSRAIEGWDEGTDFGASEVPLEAQRMRKRRLGERLGRHNSLVRRVAEALEKEGARLFENPFDCLACFAQEGLLVEVKTLDGTEEDERIRVREALSQLLYYESFVTSPVVSKRAVRKVACFETHISNEHLLWLQKWGVSVIWSSDHGFVGGGQAQSDLAGHFGF